ncbi:MAG: hypothetical protein L6V93_08245 [Clostridiales bacterium]|nr:MAG: hypothetical protein L6V93_08245 [Clostridiales bacterium]
MTASRKRFERDVADFYKDHPNCEVVLEEGGSALMAKIAANDAPRHYQNKLHFGLTYIC